MGSSNQDEHSAIPPICGIGASAGCIEALRSFFSNLPTDLGIAYVVVVHLAPDAKSELPAIVSRWTTMPAVQVADHDKFRIEADHIYLIAPDRKLEVHGPWIGASSFEQPRGKRAAIDIFLRSLAREHGDGFAVVLSGSGSDGALGARAVKDRGGMVLVQDPADAQHADMPKAVIAAGVADIVRPADKLAECLADLIRNKDRLLPAVRLPDAAVPLSDDDERALRGVFDVLRRRTGHDFSRYKRGTVLRRLSRRMQLSAQLNVVQYLEYMRANAEEAKLLLGDMLISVTTFFRDPEAWASLQSTVIAPMIETMEPGEQIRAWVVGCATGEEAYTLAMLFAEELSKRELEANFIIFASDLDETALDIARYGLYSQAIAEDVSEARLARFFRIEDEHYRVLPELRDRVVFATHNVLRDPPFSRLNLIACRNLLIYLDRDLQEQVIRVFRYASNDHAHLFLGASETADEECFRAVDKKHRIFSSRSRSEVVSLLPDIMAAAGGRAPRSLDVRQISRVAPGEVHLATLEETSPPSVLVDERWMVMHMSNSASRFFLQAGGAPARRITDLVRPELRDELHSLLHRASDAGTSQLSTFVPTRFDGAQHHVAMLVQTRLQSSEQRGFALVTFLDGGESATDMPPLEQEPTGELVRGLHEKLRMAEQRIESFRDDQYATNEDLRAANEELQSLNEEYRSTTEELETSKEELQSINEELQTVNHELKLQLEEVSRAHSDLENLMASTDVATLFLDRELRIQRFTPKLTEIFNVKTRDNDRPFSDLTHHLAYADLEQDARSVLADLAPVDREIASHSGQRFIARIRPYRTDRGRGIGGVVMTFVDVTAIKSAESALRASEQRLENELNVMRRLHRMAMAVTSAAALTEALDQILAAALELHDADMGTIHLVDGDHALEIAVQRGFGVDAITPLHRVAASDATPFGRALQSGDSIRIRDIAEANNDISASFGEAAAHFRSVQITPAIRRNGETVALISVYFRQPRAYGERDKQLGDLLAQQAAALIEHRLQQDHLASLNEALGRRTAELESSQESLARTAADLIEQDRHRDDFLAALGHELRNPLAAIVSGITGITATDARSRHAVEVLRRQSRNITRLVNDLLDTSRVKRGRLNLQCAPVNLKDAVNQALETARAFADSKKLRLSAQLPSHEVIVHADAERLSQVLDNLLRNAITYTDTGEVEVKVTTQDHVAATAVRDTGIGIDPADAPHLFDAYDRGRVRSGAGIGLGLALVKSLVEAHRGTVSFRSEGIGKGSEFCFTLPQVDHDAAPSATVKIPSVSTSPERVLIVDDQIDVADTFRFLVEAYGHTVELAYSGKEALVLAEKMLPSFALIDMSMPDMNGLELTRRLRHQFPTLKIIGMSGRGDMQQPARDAGVDRFLLKPVAPEDVAALFIA